MKELEIKTTVEIEELHDRAYHIGKKTNEIIKNKKWTSNESLKELLLDMENDCNNCYTGLTRDSDFEKALSTMYDIVFKRLEKELGE